jgi:hypothetical protein
MMRNLKAISKVVRLGTIVFILGFSPISNMIYSANADPGDDCFLLAEKTSIRIQVYREVGDSQKGSPVWRHPIDLPKGGSQRIFHGQAGTSHRLRYDYGDQAGVDLHGDVGFTCRNNDKIVVP